MFSVLTAISYEISEVVHIAELANKSRKTIVSDLAALSRQIHKAMASSKGLATPELLKYTPDDNTYNSILLSEVFYREMCYCKRAIEFIDFICSRYTEEENELEGNNDWDYVETLPHTASDIQSSLNKLSLSQQLMVGSNLLHTRMNTFLNRFVKPDISFNLIRERFSNSIESLDTPTPSPTHGQMQTDFQELYSISNHAWNMMSLLASFNLFRLAHGSIYDLEPIVPNGSIFYKNNI
jgi:hypothetical protein